mmetsp:Transcript_33252/g.72653  ORF Transcript_33252/g.72653 Transcript_33252/m.72653 type:complete len:378 (-) Transcript_33252:457-1590(-)
MRVTVFAVSAHHRRVVKGVGLQEALRVPVGIDVDLGQGVMQVHLLVPLGDAGLQPGEQEPQPVALLALRDQRLARALGSDALQQSLDEILRAVQVNECTHHTRCIHGVDLGDVHLDVLQQVVLVEVLGQLIDESVQIADVDQRPGIGQLGLLQEILDLHRVIHSGLAANPLHLLDVAQPSSSLNVLEVHISIIAGRQDGSQEIEHPLVAGEGLKHLHQLNGPNVVMILSGSLHHSLQILPVGAQQVMHALQRGFRGHLPKQVLQELRRHGVRMSQAPLDVRCLRVMLHGPLVQPCLLAQATDVLLVVVREHAHLEDGLRHLRCVHDIHLQELGLQVGLLWQVGLQRVQQDGGDLLEFVVLQEHLDHHVDVHKRRLVV